MTLLLPCAGPRFGCHSVHMQGIQPFRISRGAVGGPVQKRVSGSARLAKAAEDIKLEKLLCSCLEGSHGEAQASAFIPAAPQTAVMASR